MIPNGMEVNPNYQDISSPGTSESCRIQQKRYGFHTELFTRNIDCELAIVYCSKRTGFAG
jgi:hypothetical protein